MSEGLGFTNSGLPDNVKEDSIRLGLKRKRNEFEAHLPVLQGTGGRETAEWDKMAYRVSRLPGTIGKELLLSAIGHIFTIDSARCKIHSLAYDASYESEPRYKTATISFHTRPPQLDLALAESGGWSIDLEREVAEKYGFDRIYFDIHFEGFTPFSPAEKSDDQTIDCVVIHGWAGHALGSFKSPRPPYVWLRDSLPNDCPQLRIWTYGYRSVLTDQKSIADVFEYAKTFEQQLRILRQKTKANEHSIPIIFIVHSLGGWIFKEAMARMCDSNDQNDRLNFLSTYGALFFGVPSQGMDVGALASMVRKMPARYTLNLLDKQLGYGLREKLHTEFCKKFDYRDSKIVQFYELEKSPTVTQDAVTQEWSRKGPLELLVSPESATCGRPWETGDEYVMSLDGNHSDMVKFSENDRNGYEKICNVLKDFIKDAPSTIRARKNSLGGKSKCIVSYRVEPQIPPKSTELTEDQKACLQSLHFPEMHWRRDDISDPAFTTCRWILKHQSYKKWYKDQRGFLWIKGNPGAGKSTVLKYAFEAAKRSNEGLILASFFFHGRGSLIQKSPLGLFRSLLHQILQQVPGLLTEFASLYRQRCDTEGPNGQKWDWRERDLQIFISSHVAETAKTLPMRLYIDALDECGQESAINLVEYFYRLTGSVAICFACRRYPIVSLEEDGIEISVELGNFPDIEAYISNRIQHVIQDEKVASSIRHELIDRSASNFQWVVLVTPRVITSYKKGKSLKQICMLIRGLPSELATLYENIIRRTEPDEMRQALHLFQWICFAFRPLTLQEIREATALDIHSSHTSLQESRTSDQYAETDEEMERRVLNLSQGLAEVERHGAKRIVQLIHQSVMDFLLQQGFHLFIERLPRDRLKGSIIAQAHFWISRACIKYISMDEVASFWIPSILADEPRPVLHQKLLEEFHLIQYAVENWIAHTQIVEQENVVQDDLIELLRPIPVLHKGDWVIKDLISRPRIGNRFTPGMTLIHIASRFGLLSVVSCILEQDTRNAEIDARDNREGTPLHHAAVAGHVAIKKYLLENGAQKDCRDAMSRTPMHIAAGEGHKGVVHLLLEAGAAVDLRCDRSQTPLFYAAETGQEDVVRLLLSWGAEANIVDDHGKTALFHAAETGQEDVARLLLNWGAEANIVDDYGETALFPTACGGSKTTVELLLQNGAQINTASTVGETPISCAVRWGHESIVRLLLEHGANPDSVGNRGITPLHFAALKPSNNIVELLLERGVPVDTKDKDGRTPISWAVEKGCISVVRLLLEYGASLVSADDEGVTLLHSAASQGSDHIVELLLERGVPVNTKDKGGRTPISRAVRQGYKPVVRLLLENGADPDSVIYHDISRASDNGFHEVVKLIASAKQAEKLSSGNQTPHNQMGTAFTKETSKKER